MKPKKSSPHRINRGGAVFRYGISDEGQLEAWLNEHSNATAIAFMGRSNVGKSSLINALFGRKTARVSKTPGRTREINIFDFTLTYNNRPNLEKNFTLFDLPGYGHAEVSKEMAKGWRRLMDLFFSTLPKEVLVVNIQDARHPAQAADDQFQQYIEQFDIPAIMVLNKIDKIKTQKEKMALKKIAEGIAVKTMIRTAENIKIHMVSAETGEGLEELEQVIIQNLLDEESSVF